MSVLKRHIDQPGPNWLGWKTAAAVGVTVIPWGAWAGDPTGPVSAINCDSPLAIASWFDPFFLAYNLVLLCIAVCVVPGITYFYVSTMKMEKLRRLRNDLGEARWNDNGQAIGKYIAGQFRLRTYVGSLLTLSLVILLGASILLLLKVVPSHAESFGCGVDYSKGANPLILGTYVEQFGVNTSVYFHRVVVSLTAFQFGFLGAYVYLIGDIVRSYFTLDLSPRTLVAASIRIMTGSLLALVISFIAAYLDGSSNGASGGALDNALPAIAFIIGSFPEIGLVFLKKWVYDKLGLGQDQANFIELSRLPGMSYAHQTRLMREGYDNVENLSNARPFDLVLLTGFSYRQIRQWLGQAWLCMHLHEQDYDDFSKHTGITSADELLLFVDANATAEALLNTATDNKYPGKITVLCQLAKTWKVRVDRDFQADS
jgi:hypothetical protein